MRRTKEDADITRERLLDVALEIFSQKGYASTTLSDIAKAAGMTRGAIYWHFGGKAELYNSLVNERFSKANEVIGNILKSNDSPMEKIKALIITTIEFVESDPEYRAIMELTLLKTEVIGEVEEMMEQKRAGTLAMFSEIEIILDLGIKEGQLRDNLNIKSTAIAIISLTNGIVSFWLMNPNSFKIKEHAQCITEMFIRGIKK